MDWLFWEDNSVLRYHKSPPLFGLVWLILPTVHPASPLCFACHTPEAASPQLTDRRKKENTAEYTHLKRRRLLYTDYLALVIYFAGRFYRHFSTTAFLGITVHFFGCRDIFVDFPPPSKNELRAPRRGYRNWVIVCSLEDGMMFFAGPFHHIHLLGETRQVLFGGWI